MNKKVFYLIIIGFAISFVFYGCKKDADKDNSLSYILEKGTLIIGLDDHFPPMGFRDENDNIVGFDIDMAEELTSRMGIQLICNPIQWGNKFSELNAKKIDLIWNGFSITEERKDLVDFSLPYLANKIIIVAKTESQIDKKEDLYGKVVGVQAGSSAEAVILNDTNTFSNLENLITFNDNIEAFLAIDDQTIDALVTDEAFCRYYLTSVVNNSDDYKLATENFGEELYGVGFRKGEQAFLDYVNDHLYEMIADGTVGLISIKWFGEDITK